MSPRNPLLAIGLLLLGCGHEADHFQMAPKPAARARSLLQSNLVIRWTHVVAEPDLIYGVLTAMNVGKHPVPVVDRWNSWGAYQWRVTVGTESAENPQHIWYANRYSETILAPGEVRHARFYVTRSVKRAHIGDAAWWFVVGGSTPIYSPQNAIAPSPSFARGQEVALVMDGGVRMDAPATDC